MDMDVCAKYLVALSNLTDGDIDKMAIDDFVNAATTVVTFSIRRCPKCRASRIRTGFLYPPVANGIIKYAVVGIKLVI